MKSELSPRKTAKRIVTLALVILSSLSASGQNIEVYPTTTKYWFPEYTQCVCDPTAYDCYRFFYPFSNGQPDLHRQLRVNGYYSSSTKTIYGIAIPIVNCLEPQNNDINNRQWKDLMAYLDTGHFNVYILSRATELKNTMLRVLAKERYKLGENATIGSLLHMPEQDNAGYLCPAINANVLEIYFNTPITTWNDSIWVASPRIPCTFYYPESDLFNNLVHINKGSAYKTLRLGAIQQNDSTLVDLFQNADNGCSNHCYGWGGPFPIMQPPTECLRPVFAEVVEQHYRGATIAWTQQMGTAYSELEYGPRGYADGTGTLVSPVYANNSHRCSATIDSLAMESDYTVRMRSWCSQQNAFTDWDTLEFTTELFHTVTVAVNNPYWATPYGSGHYRAGSQATIRALPKSEYCHFHIWSDGVTVNMRNITVTQDSLLTAVYSCDTAAGIGATETALLSIVPNPASGMVRIACSATMEKIEIIDMQGRTVRLVEPAADSAELDLADLPRGVYLVTVITPQGMETRKIILE